MHDFFTKILASFEAHKNSPAIIIRDQVYTYDALLSYAYYLSFYFVECQSNNAICVILSEKTIDLYAGMLACFFSNAIYTPLNVNSAIEKNKLILSIIMPRLIFIGDMDYDRACELLVSMTDATILFTHKTLYDQCKNRLNANTLIYINSPFDNFILQTNRFSEWYAQHKRQQTAYLFFTSGSTGVPKAVPISYQNLDAYVSAIFSIFSFADHDRLIQLSDIAFDISIHEIIISLVSGAVLYSYDEQYELSVAQFIARNRITQCILVPSTLQLIANQSQFYDACLSSLKCTLVCGESFPVAFARRWELVAPQSIIVNLYGPTEATICCTYHVYQKNHDYASQILPIGKPFPGIQIELSQLSELIIVGNQVSNGYWYNDVKTAEKFKYSVTHHAMAYFTGDRASYNEPLGYYFHGRLDDQWQIKGYRIEKNEVENALRTVLDLPNIYVAPQTDQHKMTTHLIAFSTEAIDLSRYKNQLRQVLPEPAIPIKTIQLDKIPTLSNGKTNYQQLAERADVC